MFAFLIIMIFAVGVACSFVSGDIIPGLMVTGLTILTFTAGEVSSLLNDIKRK